MEKLQEINKAALGKDGSTFTDFASVLKHNIDEAIVDAYGDPELTEILEAIKRHMPGLLAIDSLLCKYDEFLDQYMNPDEQEYPHKHYNRNFSRVA